MIEVSLTLPQQIMVEAAARRRFDRHEGDPTRVPWHTLDAEIASLGAEVAVGIAIGEPWEERLEADPEGDLLPGTQVKHTEYATGHLPLQPDKTVDDHIYYLATGRYPHYTIVGWISGRRGLVIGKRVEWKPGWPCIAVEQHQLEEAT